MPGDFSGYGSTQRTKDQYDRAICLLDDIEGADRWTVSGTGADYTGSSVSAACQFGSNGWQMKTRATGPAQNDYCLSTRYVCYPVGSTLYIRLRFMVPSLTVLDNVLWSFDLYNGTRHYLAAIKWTPQTPKVEYLNSSGTYTQITEFAYTLVGYGWYTLEIQLDLSSMEYGTIRFAGASKDLSGTAFQNVEAATTRAASFSMRIQTDGAAQAEYETDSVYIGTEEYL